MNPFGQVADHYDAEFSRQGTGLFQRRLVHQLLEPHLPPEGSAVLELNAGTGTDALNFQNRGYDVIPTDGSEEMVALMTEKGLPAIQWDLNNPRPDILKRDFPLVFSNFSGWNCVSPESLKSLGKVLSGSMSSGSTLAVVVFGPRCILENKYMFFAGRWKQFGRRRKPAVKAKVGQSSMTIWNYRVVDLAGILSPHFELVVQHPIGLFLPPSYIRIPAFARGLLKVGYRMDRTIAKLGFLAPYADHMLLVFQKKQ